MKHIRQRMTVVAAALGAAARVSCGDVVRSGQSPMFVVIDSLQARSGGITLGPLSGSLQSDVITMVRTPLPCSANSPCPTVFNDSGTASFHLSQKDTTSATAPTTNNAVTLNRYRVTFRRADGRNTPGVDVPYGFDGGMTVTIPPVGSASVTFELVRHVNKEESPLVQLINSPTIISTIADITFYGQDQVGNEVMVTGSITVDFGNFGDQ